ACRTSADGPPPDLDTFLQDAPPAERNALRSVLETIQQKAHPLPDGGTVAWDVDPTATERAKPADNGATVDLPPPDAKTLNRAPDPTARFVPADPVTGVFSSAAGAGPSSVVLPGKRGEVKVVGYEILGEL